MGAGHAAPATRYHERKMSKPRILVLGTTGMLGHKMWQTLSADFDDVHGTMRSSKSDARWDAFPFLRAKNIVDGIDATVTDDVLRVVRDLKPGVIVNCIGAIKQRASAEDPLVSIGLNSLLPHQLAAEADNWGGRLIHFSTDCVFSGHRGSYSEEDLSDAEDLYGKSKHLGELIRGNAVVLRTSIIGRELEHHASLLDWFLLGGHTSVRGFTRALWSGVTTNHLSKLVGEIIMKFGYLKGLYQVSSGSISKHELLTMVKEAYGMPVEVVPDDSFFCDRSLKGDKFQSAIGYTSPGWQAMLDEMIRDATAYKKLNTH